MTAIAIIAVSDCATGVALIDHLCIVGAACLPGGDYRGSIGRTHGANLRGSHSVVAEIVHQLAAAGGSNVAQAIVQSVRPNLQRHECH